MHKSSDTLHYIAPGKPHSQRLQAIACRATMQNGLVESFNGSFSEECLNETLFSSLAQARHEIKAWKDDYNTERLHSSLGNLTPNEYAAQSALKLAAA
nr:transposase [uncultured Cohaesibacter sp.]